MKKIAVIVLLLCMSQLSAANHHIRDGATGANNGSDWNNAYTNLSAVTWTRGDTYYVADGNYASITLNIAASGTTQIFLLKAVETVHGSSIGWLSIYGDGTAVFTGRMLFGPTSGNSQNGYWTFDGVTGGGYPDWKTGFGFKIEVLGKNPGTNALQSTTPFVTMAHFEVQGNGGEGNINPSGPANDGVDCTSSTCNDLHVHHCYIHDMGRAPFLIRGDRFLLEHCYIDRNESQSNEHAEGLRIRCNRCAPTDNIVRYNIWEDIQGTGVIIVEGDGHEFYGNFMFSPTPYRRHGNGLIGHISTNADLTNTKVYNNTFINFGAKASVFFTGTPSTGNEAYNNLWYDNIGGAGFVGFAMHDYTTYISTDVNTPLSANEEDIIGPDPFTDWINGDASLVAATTPGLSLSVPYNLDITGVVRGADGVWDRGAYEFSGLSTPPSKVGNINLVVTPQ